MRRPTAVHNCIFMILGENLGVSLLPISMVPVSGLVPWIQLETQVNPKEADLEGLVAETEGLITAHEESKIAGARTDVEVQNLMIVPKAWNPYLWSHSRLGKHYMYLNF